VQVDPGSAINVIPLRRVRKLGIPTRKLSSAKTLIQGYNAESQKAMGKIRLKCQIADLKTEVTCYVIENETSNSLFAGKAVDPCKRHFTFNFAPVFQVRLQER